MGPLCTGTSRATSVRLADRSPIDQRVRQLGHIEQGKNNQRRQGVILCASHQATHRSSSNWNAINNFLEPVHLPVNPRVDEASYGLNRTPVAQGSSTQAQADWSKLQSAPAFDLATPGCLEGPHL